MMRDVERPRRDILLALGTGLSVSLAGCGGTGDGQTPTGAPGTGENRATDEPTPTPTPQPTEQNTPDTTPTDAAVTPTPTTIDRSALEQAIADRVNEVRKANGVGFLNWDEELREIARDHSWDMIRSEYFGHRDPMGRNWTDRYHSAGYRCTVSSSGTSNTGGECLARASYETPPSNEHIAINVVEQLRADTQGGGMLAESWNVHGIGVVQDPTVTETVIYVTQNFC